MNRRNINAVLNDHDRALLAIRGVVGVYAGLLQDGKAPCLKVMVVGNRSLRRRTPKTIERHPVFIEESGIIRPLKG